MTAMSIGGRRKWRLKKTSINGKRSYILFGADEGRIRLKAPNRAVLTLAIGKKLYLDMAFNLARSFSLWHKKSDIEFFLVTDLGEANPSDLRFVKRIQKKPLEMPVGFTSKLHLDELTPAIKTLFIDADCLIFGNLEPVFLQFEGKSVSVVGNRISAGEWFGDVHKLCKNFKVSSLPKFNGGIYYLEKTKKTKSIYAQARALENKYDELGLVRLRGRPNDELLMAISMAIHGESEVEDDGEIMGDLLSCPEILSLDLFAGVASLRNPPVGSARHRDWYPVGIIKPVIVHFLGDFTSYREYQEVTKMLKLHTHRKWCPQIAKIYIYLTYSIWKKIIENLKNILRPAYHLLFGFRKIPTSPRL